MRRHLCGNTATVVPPVDGDLADGLGRFVRFAVGELAVMAAELDKQCAEDCDTYNRIGLSMI